MKIDSVVKKETGYISLWVLILSVLMQAVYLLIHKWNYTVLLGNLLGAAAAIGNFFLMGLSVQKSLSMEEKEAKNGIKASQGLRTLMLFAIGALGVFAPCFETISVLVPLFFPRLAIAARPLFLKKNS